MNKQEFSLFVMALKTYYPRENLLPNNQAMELWFMQLQDIDYKVAETALNKWVATNKWSPSIADIREAASTLCNGNIPDWSEGWESVMMACRTYGRNRALEAVESLDSVTRDTVKRIGGFTYLCNSESTVADRARFQEVYDAIASRKKQESQLPSNVLALIGNMKNLQIEEKG